MPEDFEADAVDTEFTVTTDKLDYAPGETAIITADGFEPGSSLEFQVEHVIDWGADQTYGTADDVRDNGPDGTEGTADDGTGPAGDTNSDHDPIFIVDGGAGDLDGLVNGSISFQWYVNPDDSLNENFLVTATVDTNGDGSFGGSDEIATNFFTDAGGAYTLNFAAANPADYLPPIPFPGAPGTDYITGGRGDGSLQIPLADFNDGSSDVKVESLAPQDMALGQIVPFETKISVSGDTTPEDGVITFVIGWSTLTTNSGDFGYDARVDDIGYGVIEAFIDTSDGAHFDPGGDAQVDSFTWSLINDEIVGIFTVSGLDDGDEVVLEPWLVLDDTIPAGIGGNVQSRLIDAATGGDQTINVANSGAITLVNGDAISTGNQTVPLLKPSDFFNANVDLSITKTDDADPIIQGETLTYTITATNAGPSVANSVVIYDELDPNVTFVSASDGGFINTDTLDAIPDGAVQWNVGALAPGDSVVYTLEVTVNEDAPTDSLTGEDLLNTVTITTISNDIDPTNNTDVEPTDVTQRNEAPALTVTKDGPVSVNEGGAIATFTVQLINGDGTGGDEDPIEITSINDSVYGDLLAEAEADWVFDGNSLQDLNGDGTFGIVLQPQESFTFDFDGAINENAGETHTNVVLVQGVTDDPGETVSDSDDHLVDVDNVAPVIAIVKDGEATINEGGDTATYSILLTNNSVSTDPVTITSLSDDKFGDLLAEAEAANGGPITLASGESFTFSFDRPLTLDVGETHTNVATVVATDDEGDTATANDDHVVGADNVAPVIAIVKDGEATINEGGDTATYSILLTNNSVSTDPVTITSLSDDKFGDLLAEAEAANGGPITLASGESFTFSFDRPLTLDVGETHTNVATVVATDDEGDTATANDDHVVGADNVAPVIAIVKDGEATINEGGDTATYSILLTNNSVSTDPVTITSLSDDKFGDLLAEAEAANGGPITLASGESFTFSFDRPLTLDVGETHTNVATVVATDDEGDTATANDDHVVGADNVAPVIAIVKDGEATINEGGDTATYSILLTNNSVSTDPVTITSLSDDKFGDLLAEAEAANGGPITLASGESFTFSFDRPLTLDVGETHTNVATVVATDDEGDTATANDDHVVGADNVAPVIAIVKDGEATINEGGDTATYSILLTNNSVSTDPVTITSLSDDKFGDLLAEAEAANGGPITLASGESFTFSFDRPLTLDVGETHTNVATVVATDDEGDTATANDDHVVGADNVAPVIAIVKDGEATINEGGDTATYSILLTNNSVSTDPVTITSLSDDKFGDLLAEAEAANGGPITLASGESFTFSFDRPLTLDVGETHTNVATVVATDDEGDTATANDDHVVGADNVAPVIAIVKDGEATINEGGDTATYSILLTNNSVSTDPVTITSLSDDKFGDLLAEAEAANGGPITLASGESFTFSFDRPLTLDVGETHTNVATVVATDDEGDTATANDDHVVGADNVAPVIAIVKDGEATINEGGDTATYSILLTNNSVSTDPVTITSLSDDKFGDLLAEAEAANGGPITLASGESFTFSFDRPLTLDVGETHTNVATVVATDDEGDTATANDDHVVGADNVAPVIAIVKDGEATINEGGDTATYSILLTNNSVSTDPVTITSLSDDKFGDLLAEAEAANGGPITLASGESFTFSFDRPLTLDVGETHTNVATVVATDDEGDTATANDDHVVGADNVAPVIAIVKDGEATINEGGDTATYSILLTNNSVSTDPVTITSLSDDKFGDLLAEAEAANGGPITLASGESFTFSFDRPLTLDVGETHTNVATVVATDDEGDTATANDDHVVGADNVAPVIAIVKDGEATINEGGDTATYSILLTNNSVSTDPVTITSLSDDKFGDLLAEAEAANGGPITLASGESFTFSFDRPLTLDVGETHTNVATVVATDDEGDTATANDDHVVGADNVAPVIAIVKDGEATINEGGDTATYSILLTNNSVSTDPVTITSLSDDKFGDLLAEAEAANGGPITLASGESFTFSFDRPLTLDVGETHTNVATVVATDDEGDTATANDDHVVGADNVAPVIAIVKDGEATINEGGDTATYSILLTNNSVSTDPVTITSLSDDKFGDLLAEAEAANGGPITLASGESFTFSFDRPLTLDVGETHTNVATVVATDDEGDTATANDDHVVGADNVAPVIAIVKDGEATINEGGDTATYSILLTNNSVSTDPVTITSLSDDKFGDLLAEAEAANGGPITLASGESFTFSFDRPLTLDVGETHTNVATVVATDDEGDTATANDDHVVGADNVAPVIAIVKDGEATINEGGDTATYSILLTNNSVSTDPVTITSLSDDKFGDLLAEAEAANGGPITLASGESFTFSFDRPLTLDVGETHTNVATVVATDDEGDTATANDDHVVGADNVAPVIAIVKDGEATINEGGDTATYSILLTNNSVSTDPVTITSLSDDKFGDLLAEAEAANGGPITLASGESFTFSFDRPLTLDVGETHTNVATVVATDDEGDTATANDDHVVGADNVAPVIAIVKDGEATINEGGDTATYSILLTNNSVSTDPVTITSLSDDKFGDLLAEAEAANGGPITLASGESFTFSFDRPLTLDVGETHTNVATVVATDDEGDTATANDDHVVGADNVAPVIAIVKDGEATINEGGDTATYSILLTNNSVSTDPVTITSLSDDKFGDLLAEAEAANGGPITLASGESFTFSFDRPLTLDVGETHTNVATVVATDDEGDTATANDDHVVGADNVAPVIAIVKDGEATINEGGDTATYSILLTNNSVSTDPVTITSLSDDKFGDLLAEAEAANGGPITLASGESFTFSFDRPLTLDVGETHTNVATVVATDDEGDTATANDDHVVGADNVAPVIAIVKDGEATINEGGDTATYSILLTNNSVSTDPVTITSLSDDKFGDLLAEAEAANGGPITLASGESFTFSFDRPLTLDVGETHTNVATVVATDDEGDTATANDDHVVGADNVAPVIAIVKDGEATINEGGDTATYSILLTNNSVSTDPVTITSLSDDKFGDLLAEAEAANGGPITLASGESFTFSFDRPLTLDVGETHTNVATVVATDDEGDTATANDDHVVGADNVAPVIAIVKDGEATINEGGDTATYSILLTNNSVSTDPVTITSLSDDKFGDLLAEAEAANGGPITLASGESFTFSFDRPLTLDVGETHTNVATVVATDDEGDTATANDDHVVGADNLAPVIAIVKTSDGAVNEDGDMQEYFFTVTNNSVSTDPVTITSLSDDKFGDLLAEAEAANGGPITLDPDESFSFSVERYLDLVAGEEHENVVTVIGVDDEGTSATDNDNDVVTADPIYQRSIFLDTSEQEGDYSRSTDDDGHDLLSTTIVINDDSDDAQEQYDVSIDKIWFEFSDPTGKGKMKDIEGVELERLWIDADGNGKFDAGEEEIAFSDDDGDGEYDVFIVIEEPADTLNLGVEWDFGDNLLPSTGDSADDLNWTANMTVPGSNLNGRGGKEKIYSSSASVDVDGVGFDIA